MPKKAKKTAMAQECSICAARCCKYLNIVVENPRTPEEVEYLLWHIFHGASEVYLDEDGDWSVVFHNECYHLTQDNRCMIYERRPAICRQFSSTGCHGDVFEESIREHFKTAADLIGYIKKKRPALFKRLNSHIRRMAPAVR